ncbi:MAG: TIR domain-containing protein [Labedaea sp.]
MIRQAGDGAHSYDIAVSFAGAQREYVERVIEVCKARDLRVFYDRDNTVDLWGRNFVYEMRIIYGGTRARYFVPFISAEYLNGAYPMDEFDAATSQAIQRGNDGYILPILVGDVRVPPVLLNPAIGYLRAERYTTDGLADAIAYRVRVAEQQHQDPRDIGDVVESALRVRLPRVAAVSFSELDTLQAALNRVSELFTQASDRLAPYGYTCHVHTSDVAVEVRVEAVGKLVCGLRVQFEDGWGEDKLGVSFGWPRITGNGINGWAAAAWDPDARQAKLRYTDFGAMASGTLNKLITIDEFFTMLWEKIVTFLESQPRGGGRR